MFVILAYDVGEKRVSKVAKKVKKFLFPVQRSLYQGFITEAKLKKLKKEVDSVIDKSSDSIIIYKLNDENTLRFEEIGISKISENYIL